MRAILLPVSALTMLILASSVQAQSVEAPTYSVGDTWTVKAGKDTREVRVLKVSDGGSVDVLGFNQLCPTCIVQLDRSLSILAVLGGDGKPADPTQVPVVQIGGEWRLYEWPLEPKKQWNFTAVGFVRGTSETYDLKNRVEKLEEVKTAAGTFKAYKIVREWLMRSRPQVRGGREYPMADHDMVCSRREILREDHYDLERPWCPGSGTRLVQDQVAFQGKG